MKRKLLFWIVLISAILFSTLLCTAAEVSTPPAGVIQQRQSVVASRIKKRFGSFGETFVQNVKLDKSIFALKEQRGFDYLFTPEFKEKGIRFIEDHQSVFDYVETTFKIPRTAITAAPAIEWWYEPRTVWPVGSTLFSLAVLSRSPTKRAWAEKELFIFLDLAARNPLTKENPNGWDPLTMPGSWEGAFGLFQFIASSYKFDSMRWDGTACVAWTALPFPDPFNPDDVICSVANYLHRAGWGTSEASHRKAVLAYNHWPSYVNAFLDYQAFLENKPRLRYRPRSTFQRAAIK